MVVVKSRISIKWLPKKNIYEWSESFLLCVSKLTSRSGDCSLSSSLSICQHIHRISTSVHQRNVYILILWRCRNEIFVKFEISTVRQWTDAYKPNRLLIFKELPHVDYTKKALGNKDHCNIHRMGKDHRQFDNKRESLVSMKGLGHR